MLSKAYERHAFVPKQQSYNKSEKASRLILNTGYLL